MQPTLKANSILLRLCFSFSDSHISRNLMMGNANSVVLYYYIIVAIVQQSIKS